MMKRFVFAILLILLVPFVLAQDGEEHEEDSCGIDAPAPGERGCAFPGAENPETVREWMIVKFRPGFEADTARNWAYGIAALLVVLIAGWRWTKLKPKQRKLMFWLKTLGWIIVMLAVLYIAYATYYTWYNDISTTGLEICDEQGCRLSMHWHAELEKMSVCGEIVERKWEEGDLAGPHTHKDDRIHLHTVLKIDPQSKELLERTPMTIGGFFDAMGWQYNKTCFKDTCAISLSARIRPPRSSWWVWL